ncbi:MAG: ABC transporter permease [Candidatus Caenarcaniphilales bacterium]|nr:ABC transporter permease [Candidatus Caenarcaniphilales bacterium]
MTDKMNSLDLAGVHHDVPAPESTIEQIKKFWNEEVKPIMVKEWVHIFNDITTLRIAIVIPLFQLTIFGYAINNEVRNVSTYVFDQDQSKASTQFLQKAEATTFFKINKFVGSRDELSDSLVSGKAKVAIAIPPGYNRDFNAGHSSQIQVLIDGSDSNVASQAQSALQLLGSSVSQDKNQKNRIGSMEQSNQLVEVRPRFLFNPNLETAYLIVPGLLGIIVFLVTSFLCSLSIVSEKEKGTLEQLLVTPLSPLGLMIGKVIPYMTIGFFDFNLSLLLMYVVFGIPIRGNFLLLELAVIIFMFSSLGVSLVISALAKSQTQASQLVMMQMLPSILLSGYIFPFESMPSIFKFIGYALPVTHFIAISRGIILRGTEFHHLWIPFLVLLVYGLVILRISVKVFKKQIA